MTRLKAPIAVFLAALLTLTLTSCANNVTTDLDLLVTSTSAAVDIAFPQYAAQLGPYFADVTTFIDQVTTELATTDTPAEKAAVIAADAAKIAAPNLTGISGDVATRIAAIAPLVAQIVTEVMDLSSELDRVAPGGANAFFAAHKVKSPNAKDLAKIRAKNAALKAKLAQVKKTG
jgi:hypothetical protein